MCFFIRQCLQKKGYSVEFRDLEGCHTCGDDLEDVIEMAEVHLHLPSTGTKGMKKTFQSLQRNSNMEKMRL